jgi:hypothetical protein
MTGGKTIACPSCGGTVAVRAAGYTITIACRYCGALLDVANPDVRVITEYGEAVAHLALPLGSRGTLFGVEWEAIGWQERQSSNAVWTETLLFNPYAGYRWLVHAEGQWQFGEMLVDQPQAVADDAVVWRGRTFTLTDPTDTYVTNRVLGEFYWRVQVGETVAGSGYAGGNDTLSLERNADEINWTHLVTLHPSQVRTAFRKPPEDGAPPESDATAPPSGYGLRDRWADLPGFGDNDFPKMVAIAMLSLVLVLTGMMTLGAVGAVVNRRLSVPIDGPAVETSLGTLTIERPSQAVRLTAMTDSAFTNKWVDIDYALVDRRTQHAIRAEGTLEFYAGIDTDGSRWTEGDRATVLEVASVPRGTYEVIAQAQGHTWTDPKAMSSATNGWDSVITDGHDVMVVAQLGGMEWGVFITVLVLIVSPLAIVLYWQVRQGQSA